MRVIENEMLVYFDVDDTLILHLYDNSSVDALANGYILFDDTYTGTKFLAKPSEKHIKLLKDYKLRGFFVIVHSGAGYRHAESVINQLNLETYVDVVCTKPTRYVDDLPAGEWMGGRIYLEKL